MENSNIQPLTLTLESHGKKVSITLPNSDVNIDEMIDVVKGVLIASGWNKDLIDEVIP